MTIENEHITNFKKLAITNNQGQGKGSSLGVNELDQKSKDSVGKIINEFSENIKEPLDKIQKLILETEIPMPNQWFGISVDENGIISTLINVSTILEVLSQRDVII